LYGTYDPLGHQISRAIKRVIGIGRVSIDTNVEAIAAQLDLPLRRVVDSPVMKSVQSPLCGAT
jgi:hypothetical protein